MILRIAILCLLAAALTAQEPASGLASITGRVISAVDGAPLPGSLILLRGASSEKTWAGSDGRFRLSGLAPGTLTLLVSKAGHHIDQRRQRIVAGEAVAGIIVRLLPQAVISGTAVGADGEPLEGATALLWQQPDRLGELPSIVMRRGEIINDLGEFRFYGLYPGDYIVTLEPPETPAPQGRTVLTAAPMIYPPAGSVSELALLRVKAGDHIDNVDFRAGPPAQTGIQGEIISSSEASCGQCRVGFYRRLGETYAPVLELSSAPDGTFYVQGLEPGRYVVAVNRSGTPGHALAEAVATAGSVTTTRPYMSAGAEINVVVKLLNPPAQDEAAGRGPRQRPAVQFDYLGPVLAQNGGRGGRPVNRAEGITEYLSSGHAPGPYAVRVRGIPEGGYVDSVLLDGQPLLNGRFEMGADTVRRELEVVIAFNSGVVEGTVETDTDLPLADARIYLLPTTPVLPSDVAQTITDDEGAFSQQVAPGRYEAYALPRESDWNLADPLDRLRLTAYRTLLEVRAGQITGTRLKLGPISGW